MGLFNMHKIKKQNHLWNMQLLLIKLQHLQCEFCIASIVQIYHLRHSFKGNIFKVTYIVFNFQAEEKKKVQFYRSRDCSCYCSTSLIILTSTNSTETRSSGIRMFSCCFSNLDMISCKEFERFSFFATNFAYTCLPSFIFSHDFLTVCTVEVFTCIYVRLCTGNL